MSRKRERFLNGVVEGFYGRPWTTEQRLDLYSNMSRLGMNTYLYAPKDDDKHRACWRDLYSLEEADQLAQLIREAQNRGISFIYAIAPGLDITFSNNRDVDFLKRKLDQVAALGCRSFAVLFDDINCDMCPADAKEFPSFAHAQVTVTNDIYSHLDQPDVFLFCPTEYCASRAVPSVSESQYLKHLGAELHPNIDIMWTGPKVISKAIPLSSIEELGEVLQRPPVIWDNLHANDYDQGRLFLGPYVGRPVALLSKLNGVLTNPNCEYGANYVAIHTMAQWSRCANKATKRPSPVRQAMKLEMEGIVDESTGPGKGCAAESDVHLYEPKRALEIALKEWILEFKIPRRKPEHYKPVKDATSVAKAKDSDQLSLTCSDSADVQGSLAEVTECLDLDVDKEVISVCTEPFTVNDLRLLVDFFYLPHQHGEKALHLLEEFCWLKEHSPSYEALRASGKLLRGEEEDEGSGGRGEGESKVPGVESDGMRSDGEASESIADEDISAAEVTQWCERAKKFHDACERVSEMYDRLTAIPNRPLLYDIYRYVWDVKETTIMLDSYVSWLETGGSEVNPEHEPHIMKGGITAEMQRMLPQKDGSKSAFCKPKSPKKPTTKIFTIRPYRQGDRDLVYQTCLETGDNGEDATTLFTNYPDLLGDRYVGPYTTISPELSFVVEDSEGVCGYVLAALDSSQFYDCFLNDWLPTVIGKYPKPSAGEEKLNPEQELLCKLHSPTFYLPVFLQRDFPSHLHIDLMKRAQGEGVGGRMIDTILATLKAKGSCGVHLEMAAGNTRALKFYLKKGFIVLDLGKDPTVKPPPKDVLILAKIL